MHSYKRIYIISSKYCIFKSIEIGGIKNKNPLYYWRSIGEISHYCSEMRCSKSAAKISNNSETTKKFHHFLFFLM